MPWGGARGVNGAAYIPYVEYSIWAKHPNLVRAVSGLS